MGSYAWWPRLASVVARDGGGSVGSVLLHFGYCDDIGVIYADSDLFELSPDARRRLSDGTCRTAGWADLESRPSEDRWSDKASATNRARR